MIQFNETYTINNGQDETFPYLATLENKDFVLLNGCCG